MVKRVRSGSEVGIQIRVFKVMKLGLQSLCADVEMGAETHRFMGSNGRVWKLKWMS